MPMAIFSDLRILGAHVEEGCCTKPRFRQSSQCLIQLLQTVSSSRQFAFSQFSDNAHDVRDVFFVLFSFSVQTLDPLTTSIAVYL